MPRYYGVHQLLLPVLPAAVELLEVLLVGLLHRLTLLVGFIEFPLGLPDDGRAFVEEGLAGDLYFSVEVLCEFEGMASSLLVLDLEGGGEVGEGSGFLRVDVLAQPFAHSN